MTRTIITHNEIIGFHCYPQAPEWCSYLKNKHRHVFVIECHFTVSHNEREIEINEQQKQISQIFLNAFGSPCEFGDMSCESIAEWILNAFVNATEVKVLEDGYGGASLTR